MEGRTPYSEVSQIHFWTYTDILQHCYAFCFLEDIAYY